MTFVSMTAMDDGDSACDEYGFHKGDPDMQPSCLISICNLLDGILLPGIIDLFYLDT